jgi:hypothetical protein
LVDGVLRAHPVALCLLATLGCQAEATGSLRVHVRTDLAPIAQVIAVRTERFDAIPTAQEQAPRTRRDFVPRDKTAFEQSAEVARYADVRAGDHIVRVRLLGGDGATLLERLAVVEVPPGFPHIVTLVLTRDCRGVMCPGPADNPTLLACLAGRCVDPACSEENPEACGPGDCTDAAECPAAASCSEPRCVTGACLYEERAGACEATEWCNPERGCAPLPDAADGGTPPADAGAPAADAGALSMDAGSPPLDAGAPDGGPVDPATLGPFGPPTEVQELSSAGLEDDPTLTSDMLEIYFEREPADGGTSDLYVATRVRVLDPFDPPVPLAALNSSARDSAPEISGDGLTLYFSSARGGTNDLDGLDVYVSTRADRAAPWSPPQRVAELSSPLGDLAPVLSADGRIGLLASARDAAGTGLGIAGLDLYLTERARPGDPWVRPCGWPS